MSEMVTTASEHGAPRLAHLLVLSLLLHVLLLSLFNNPHVPLNSDTAINVTLVDTPAMTNQGKSAAKATRLPEHPPAEKKNSEAVRTVPTSLTQPQLADTPQPAITTAVQMPFAEPRYSGYSAQMSPSLGQEMLMEPPPGAADAARESISGQIRTRFAEHFSYPLLAQRNGWEGEVVLVFRVETDGTLSDIRVQQSSGHALLDESAIDSLNAIGRVEFSNGLLLRQSLELRMPVIYHLAQG